MIRDSLSRRTEAGAALVESAIAGLLIFFLIFLIFDGAIFARSYLAASDAATAGARAGGVSASDPLADYDILEAVKRSMSAANRQQIRKIVVFRAVGPDFEVPSGCVSAATAMCNHYGASDLSLDEESFTAEGFVKDDSWPAADRSGVGEQLGVLIELDAGTTTAVLAPKVTKVSIAKIEMG